MDFLTDHPQGHLVQIDLKRPVELGKGARTTIVLPKLARRARTRSSAAFAANRSSAVPALANSASILRSFRGQTGAWP
jgi:hypothetical protein